MFRTGTVLSIFPAQREDPVLSAPKKPGTDLAALKARLAKKSQAAREEEATPAMPRRGPPPPAPSAAPTAPVPGHGPAVGRPEPEPIIPAPGEVAAQPEPAFAPAPIATSEAEPFGGGAAFDPSEGLFDGGGEIRARGSKGLLLVGALASMGFGVAVGYLLKEISTKQALVEVGKAKGATMLQEVTNVSDTRKTISLAMDDLKKAIASDPKKGAEQLTSLLTENFDKAPKVDELFGWQLAAVHSTGVKKVFDLYEEANALKLDLGYLAGFLIEFGPAVQAGAGPAMFAALSTGTAVKLVEAVQPLCDMEAKTPCDDKSASKAVGYLVRDRLGVEPVAVPRGSESGQAVLLLPEGSIYKYAVGQEPNKNAVAVYAALMGRVHQRLEAMNKAENIALTALKNYADSPTVDDSSSQPDPGGG